MNAEPDLARIAGTVGDPRRIQMLALLIEGRALTAKELALGAGVEPATATAHLKRLVDDGLLESAAQGRHKYFRFASEQVAQLVESLMRLAPPRKNPVAARAAEPIRSARYCYDHLAGSLGTDLLALMLRKGWLENGGVDARQLALTASGEKALALLGLDIEAARERRRHFTRTDVLSRAGRARRRFIAGTHRRVRAAGLIAALAGGLARPAWRGRGHAEIDRRTRIFLARHGFGQVQGFTGRRARRTAGVEEVDGH